MRLSFTIGCLLAATLDASIAMGQGKVTIPMPGEPLPDLQDESQLDAIIEESDLVRGTVTIPEPGKPLPRFIKRPKLNRKRRTARRRNETEDKWREKVCDIMVNKFATNYAQLEKFIQTNMNPPKDNPGITISSLLPSDCDQKTRVETIKQIAGAINSNSGKIGVLIPQSGPYAQIGQEILDGMKKSARKNNFDFAKNVIVRDSRGDPNVSQRALAEMVLVHNVSAIIGGLQSAVATAILPWADKLSIPVVVLSSRVTVPENSKMAFKVFPDQRELAYALAETCKLRKYHRVAFLYPTGTGADSMAALLEQELKSQNIVVAEKATYQPTDYNTMENAARTIFRQHSAGREQEYRNMVWRARRKARRAGVPFSSRMIVLPPILGFDAVFVADNFKNVRHMAKIFQFLGVKKLPMFGHHEWRSMALVSPYDEFLDGSFFADFIGSYRDLPQELSVMQGSSPYFVKAEFAQKYDFNLIGLRAFDVTVRSMTSEKRRRKAVRALTNLREQDSKYFKIGPVFRDNHHAHWPAFIFSVQNRGIFLTSQYREVTERAPLSTPTPTPAAEPSTTPTGAPQLGAKTDAFPEKLFTH